MIELEKLRTALLGLGADIKFTKVNGDEREMMCTTNFSMIPVENHPKVNEDSSNTKTPDSNILRVWDMEIDSWRSIKVDSIIDWKPL